MVDIYAHFGGSLAIGRRGENEARRVVFELSAWRKHYGEGTVQLLHQRAGDESPYPCALTVEGDTAYWLIRAADVDKPGWGEAQLHYYVGDTLAKSAIWRTVTAEALGDPSEPPEDPARAWFAAIREQIGNLDELTTAAKDNLVAAINEAAKSGGGAGSISMRVFDGYIQYSTNGGTSWDNLIATADLQGPKGDPGADGAPGKDGADGITPHIGDNGNWYLGDEDTGKPSRGATGPAGADGKDGAGMDITGATVGQIAKVKAVDADGKPTAWEAVDMPSGGGETWEKIAEIELRSDTAEYVLADFATWRKAKVMMTRPQYISGLNKNVWCKVVGSNFGDTYSCGYLTIAYGYIFWEFTAEVNELFIAAEEVDSNNTTNAAPVKSTGSFMPLKSTVDKYKFELMFVDTSVIQAGDKVTVIGVRR